MMTSSTQRLKSSQSSSILNTSEHPPTVVLCSSKDEYLLSQDICTLCGSLGKKDEGNLICCSQCGQCYHPYCVNIKGLKVVLTKGWRCLECTVCETCGQPGDEAKLMLCDECELSFHTYCLEPPLEDVPQGSWKCHWCVVCQRCGSHSPGTKSNWQKNYTECGPCSSLTTCPKCKLDYNQSDLIINCLNCSRWLHAKCDSIRDEEECELASELGYTCLLCRPKDEIPLYIVHRKSIDNQDGVDNTSSRQNAREDSQINIDHDNVGIQKSLSSTAFDNSELDHKSDLLFPSHLYQMKDRELDFNRPRSAPLATSQDPFGIEPLKRPSSSMHFSLQDSKSAHLFDSTSRENLVNHDQTKFDDLPESERDDHDDILQNSHMSDGVYLSDVGLNFMKQQRLEPLKRQRAKRGTKVQKLDESNQDEVNRDDEEENKFNCDDEEGRKRRIRKLSKVGIGGFSVRQRGVRINKEDESTHNLKINSESSNTPHCPLSSVQNPTLENSSQPTVPSKPKRIRKKPKKKANLIDQYPSYLQEAFFGKDLLSSDDFKGINENGSDTVSNTKLDNPITSNASAITDSENTRLSVNRKKSSICRFSDINNDCSNDTMDIDRSDATKATKTDRLIDVFIDDGQEDSKKDVFDPDLLNTDFNIEMDSKVVEDLLNGLGPTSGSHKTNQISQSNEHCEQAASGSNVHPNNAVTYQTTNPSHNQVQHSSPISTVGSTVQGAQQQQQQSHSPMVTSNMSPHQLPQPHQQNQISPTMTQARALPPPSGQNYDMNELAQAGMTHMTHMNLHNNLESNTAIMVNTGPQVQSPVTLSPRAKMSSPCIPGSHRSPSTASSIGPMSSPAQQPMQHINHPPNHTGMSSMIEPETSATQYQMPQSPWTGSQPDGNRQYSPIVQSADTNWQSSNSQDMDGQGKKGCQNWELEEALGPKATKSAVLYANLEHPELKQQYAGSDERFKQIQKLWRQLPAEKRKPFVEKARENRTASKITNKPNDPTPPAKKPPPQHIHSQMKSNERVLGPHQPQPIPQQVQMTPGMIQQNQDTRWKQPIPIEVVPQQNRFIQSPHRTPSHDPNIVCQPPEIMSPSMRPLPESAPQYDHMNQPMSVPSSSSPHPQFNRPQMQPGVHVTRVRPPLIDNGRQDPYSMPPSTPRPVTIQQRSPFSPQSPFPNHSSNSATSTPPMGPRAPNDHQVIYQQSSHSAIPNQNQQSFLEPQSQVSNQYQVRQSNFSGHQRPMNPSQYNQMPMPAQPVMRAGPINTPMRLQMQPQHSSFAQQPQYRHTQPPRYVNQEINSHNATPIQHSPSGQQVHRRIQSPIAVRPMGQQNIQQMVPQQRIINQPRSQQHPIGQTVIQSHTIQHQQPPMTQQQQPMQHISQIQSQPQMQHQHHQQSVQPQQPLNQPVNQTHYSSMQTCNRVDNEDPVQLLEDEDDLKDLGADFNILEYADPEPDNATSTSAGGKNAIEIDAELEDYFDERDTLEEKRSTDQIVPMGPQQILQQHQAPQSQPIQQTQMQQQQQPHSQPQHNQPYNQSPIQQHPNRTFIQEQNQHHPIIPQQQQTHLVQQPCPTQRQPQYVGQTRVVNPNHQQYSPNQQNMMRRPNQPCPPIRMQNPQHQQQPAQPHMINYQQQRPANTRYIEQNHMSHDTHMPPQQQMHQQPMVNQQPMVSQQRMNIQQIQRGSVVQQPPQFHHQRTFDNHQNPVQPPQQHQHQHQMHSGHMHQNYQQPQQPLQQQQQQPQQHVIYNNTQVQRQYQPQPQVQQHYSYQQQHQHQTGYNHGSANPQQAPQMMKPGNEMMMQDNPIIGDTMTSMEFTMYEPGQGHPNEAVNFPSQLNEPSPGVSDQDRPLTDGENRGMMNNQGSNFARTDQGLQTHSYSHDQSCIDDSGSGGMKMNRENYQAQSGKPDINYRVSTGIPPSTSSNTEESAHNNSNTSSTNQPQNSERITGGNQPQNQLLKQLLGNCSSADNPSQDNSSAPLLIGSSIKSSPQPVGHGIIAKQIGSNVPTISFQMDPITKNSGSLIPAQQAVSSTPIRGPSLINSGRSPVAITNNYEIKTYNVSQQAQPSMNINIAPVRLQTIAPTVHSNSILHRRPDMPTVTINKSAGDPISKPQVIQETPLTQNPPVYQISAQPGKSNAEKGIKDRVNGGNVVTPIPNINPSPQSNSQSIPTESSTADPTTVVHNPIKSSVPRPPKDDYIAKRRALLEKEKTPPPQELKPKKRVRGPNKRSRNQVDDGTTINAPKGERSDGQPTKKRVRKNQSKLSKQDAENIELMLSALSRKIHTELPTITVKEPTVSIDNNVGSIFCCGDLNVHASKLRGRFGRALPVPSELTRNKGGRKKRVGYYHEEFSYESEENLNRSKERVLFDSPLYQGCDSPTSIVSESSDDESDVSPPRNRFDLKINHDCSNSYKTQIFEYFSAFRKIARSETAAGSKDINNNSRPRTPTIPIRVNLPVTHIPMKELWHKIDNPSLENDKENQENHTSPHEHPIENQISQTCDQPGNLLNMRLKDHGNVSVTLTLTNKETDGVKRVLNSLSQLIDYPIPPTSVMSDAKDQSIEKCDEKLSLTSSFRLITAPQSQIDATSSDLKDLKFNEKSYVSKMMKQIERTYHTEVMNEKKDSQDVKPEICRRCKAIVLDRGIRKSISEIPESTISAMRKLSSFEIDQVTELVFCSVNCYAASIMLSKEHNSAVHEMSTGRASSLGLPPMSPMMEEDDEGSMEDDISKTHDSRGEISSRKSLDQSELATKKRWVDIRYKRWSPSQFGLSECSDQQKSLIEHKEPPTVEDKSPLPQQVTSQSDSSIDSNDSDDLEITLGTPNGDQTPQIIQPGYYVQNISGDPILHSDPKKFRSHDQSRGRDMIIPAWPEGMDLIQMQPVRSTRKVAIENLDDDSELSHTEEIIEELYVDKRRCILCHEQGDGDSDGPARLLNISVDGWVHLNCALWSLDVYELGNGALMNVELACRKAMICAFCRRPGATLRCFKPRCPNYYHFICATKKRCTFYEDKSIQCRQHSKTTVKEMTTFVVKRRVYINRDEQKQVAEMIQSEQLNVMRIGSLVFLNIGQLLPHQLLSFHDKFHIYPVGYRVIRYYWSYRNLNKRAKYFCTIEDNDGKPIFKIVSQEPGFDDEIFTGISPQSVWHPIIEMIVNMRRQLNDIITTFPAYIRGDDLFGLNEPSIVRILESLPGVESLTDYEFKFGRSPLLELPLAVNPSGCARTEPKLRTHLKRPYTIQSANCLPKSRLQSLTNGDLSSPYIKQFVHSKSSQYRKMKSEWRNNVVLARSRVQGLGLYAARDIEKHTMVIEYIGMLIRNEIAEKYEKIHEAHVSKLYSIHDLMTVLLFD